MSQKSVSSIELLRGSISAKKLSKDFVRLKRDRTIEGNDTRERIKRMNALRNGSMEVRLSTLLRLCDYLGLDVSLKERCPIYVSWVDPFGYVVLERTYAPYCRITFNPDDLEDFKMVVGLDSSQWKYSVLIKLWRALHLHYYKVKVPNAVFYRIKKKLKSSIDGLSDDVINVYRREGEYRGRR